MEPTVGVFVHELRCKLRKSNIPLVGRALVPLGAKVHELVRVRFGLGVETLVSGYPENQLGRLLVALYALFDTMLASETIRTVKPLPLLYTKAIQIQFRAIQLMSWSFFSVSSISASG